MKEKEYNVSIYVKLKYDEAKLKEVLCAYREAINSDATQDSLLETIAAQLAMGNFFVETVGKIYPCTAQKMVLKLDPYASKAVCWETIDFSEIETLKP